MEVIDYGRGVAVIGDTKAWKNELKETYGGKWLPRLLQLEGQPGGWIFGSAKKQQLEEFVAQANSGEVSAEVQPKVVKTTVTKPTVKVATKPIAIKVPVKTKSELVDKSGVVYQTIVYKVPKPKVGQNVTLLVNDQELDYVVSDIEDSPYVDVIDTTSNTMIDSILLRPQEDSNEVSRAKLISGVWQIEGFDEVHSLVFKP